jgi:hypothetical protein
MIRLMKNDRIRIIAPPTSSTIYLDRSRAEQD